ncbi:unnamed protein product [Anisakis simplex]|uniref:Chitin synthase chs-1/2 N-terminal putative transporter domain-containing protein n=1 Tax=Anisakis simplex TaxID=6269 RepID=A0A3P6RIF3_ANISI|nr:unnamed protein product [Anisakis simplex]
MKISCFFVLFILTLTSATIAKSAFLLMTSAIGSAGHNVTICNDKIPEGSTNRIRILPQHVVKWVFIIESLHAAGIGILVFRIFPNIDAVTAAMLTNSLCLILCILSLLSRKPKRLTMLLIFFDLGCIVAQSTDFWAWPALNHSLYPYSWTVPVSLLLISLAWWPNFVHPQSMFPPIRALANFAITLNETRSKTYVFVSVWKCLIYLLAILLFIPTRLPFEQLVQSDPFGEKIITISAYNMNQTQLNKFYDRMKETESYPYYGLYLSFSYAIMHAQQF